LALVTLHSDVETKRDALKQIWFKDWGS
jgi:hypothetical protein